MNAWKTRAQCETALGAIDSLRHESDDRRHFTSTALAEALSMAQEYLLPCDRIETPVSAGTAGQLLRLLRYQGYVKPLVRLRSGPCCCQYTGVWRCIKNPLS